MAHKEKIEMGKFAWGSSQYDTLAYMFRLGSQHKFNDAVIKLSLTGYNIEAEVNFEMLKALKNGILGDMFTAWKNTAKDLWFALSMAEDVLFKYGIEITNEDGAKLEMDNPLRQSLTAILAVEYGCISEEQFKNFDT